MTLLGLSMVWGVQLLSALALKAVTALNYALLAPSVPPMCLAIALLTGYEFFDRHSRDSWLKVAGIVICVVGSVLIALTASSEAGGAASRSVIIGNVLLFCNKISIAVYPIIEKKLLGKGYDPVVIVAWGYFSGSCLTLLSVIPYLVLDTSAATGGPSPWNISAAGWRAICYAAFLTSAFNYSAMIFVNKKIGPVLVMAFYPYQAVCTPILASIFLGSVLSTNDVVGGIIIVVGLALCVLAKWRERGAVAKADQASAARAGTAAAAAAAAAATATTSDLPLPPRQPSASEEDVVVGLALDVAAMWRERSAHSSGEDGGRNGGGGAAATATANVAGEESTSLHAAEGGDNVYRRAEDGKLAFAPLTTAAPPEEPPGLER